MKVIEYDTHFNLNEWYVIGVVCVGVLVAVLLPQRFSKKRTAVYLMCGVFSGFFFDHTLSVLPVSFYDINDTSSFEFMDFLSHWGYGPFSYLYFYLYDRFTIKLRFSLIYVLAWAFLCTGLERLSSAIGVFHYQNGFKLYYSFVIYLIVEGAWVVFYYIIQTYGEKRL